MKQSMTPKLLAISMTLGLATPLNLLAQRKPLSVGPLTHLAHEPTSVRQRFDPVRETHLEYQVEGTIEFLPSSGNFLLSWNGHDGTRQREIWEPRDKVAAVVAADVTFDQASGLYTYSYTVSNLPTAIQLLQTLYFEAGTLERAEKPDDGWYSRALTEYLNKELGVAGGWAWSQTGGTLGIPPALGIPPGQTVSGFQLYLTGLVFLRIENPQQSAGAFDFRDRTIGLDVQWVRMSSPGELQLARGVIEQAIPGGYELTVGQVLSDQRLV